MTTVSGEPLCNIQTEDGPCRLPTRTPHQTHLVGEREVAEFQGAYLILRNGQRHVQNLIASKLGDLFFIRTRVGDPCRRLMFSERMRVTEVLRPMVTRYAGAMIEQLLNKIDLDATSENRLRDEIVKMRARGEIE